VRALDEHDLGARVLGLRRLDVRETPLELGALEHVVVRVQVLGVLDLAHEACPNKKDGAEVTGYV